MKKFFNKIHLWLSIPIGLNISLICFTGAILVFENEITEFCYSSRYFVEEEKEKPLSLNEILQKVAEEIPDSTSIANVQVPFDSRKTYRIGLDKPMRSYLLVDPYTAKVVYKDFNPQGNFFTKVRLMHRWLLLQGDGRTIGKNIVGVCTLIFVIILISGIVIWFPKNKNVLKNRVKIRFREGWRKFWYDFHLSAGIFTSIILLALALTGLTWSFGWYSSAFYRLFGVEMTQGGGHNRNNNQQRGEGKNEREERKKSVDFSKWQNSLEDIQKQLPEYKYITIQNGTASAGIDVFGNGRASNSYKLDKKTGNITETDLYSNRDKSGKIRGVVFSVHTGSWGGMTTRILTFLASLVGGILPLTGYYLYLKRILKKKKRRRLLA